MAPTGDRAAMDILRPDFFQDAEEAACEWQSRMKVRAWVRGRPAGSHGQELGAEEWPGTI